MRVSEQEGERETGKESEREREMEIQTGKESEGQRKSGREIETEGSYPGRGA